MSKISSYLRVTAGILLSSLSVLLITSSASAQSPPYDWIVTGARITWIEATYMPSVVPFGIDAAGGSCGAGTQLKWNGSGSDLATQQASVKAIYAALVGAKLSGTTVRLYGVNAGCIVKFIYLE